MIKCSFCGKGALAGKKMIEQQAKRIAICQTCVDVATTLLRKDGVDARGKRKTRGLSFGDRNEK